METKRNTLPLDKSNETPVRDKCDVLVVGGGTAGVIAALAAAKNGAKTILIEQNTFLGGAMLGGGVIWMGFYNIFKPYKKEPVQLVRGIADDLIRRLSKEHGTTGFYEEVADAVHESMGIHADREILPMVLLEMMEEYGVKLYLRCTVVDTVMDGDTVLGIIMESKSGREAILSKVTVDCSGEADVAWRAGALVNEIPERRSGGMVFGLGNVDFEKARVFFEERGVLAYLGYADKGGEGKDRITRLGFKLGKMPEFDKYREKYHLHIEPCIVSTREKHAGMVNGVTMNFDTTDVNAISQACIELNNCCFHMARLFREMIPGFENSFLDWTSSAPGLRFGRQVECEFDIPQSDINDHVIPDDAIGLFGVQDAHYMGYDIKGGGWYGIPYRALIPKKIENLLVAGKMISSDWVVFMSTRLIGACFLQGQAAGTAAALAAKQQIPVRELCSETLRAVLRKDGVFLG